MALLGTVIISALLLVIGLVGGFCWSRTIKGTQDNGVRTLATAFVVLPYVIVRLFGAPNFSPVVICYGIGVVVGEVFGLFYKGSQ